MSLGEIWWEFGFLRLTFLKLKYRLFFVEKLINMQLLWFFFLPIDKPPQSFFTLSSQYACDSATTLLISSSVPHFSAFEHSLHVAHWEAFKSWPRTDRLTTLNIDVAVSSSSSSPLAVLKKGIHTFFFFFLALTSLATAATHTSCRKHSHYTVCLRR